MCLRGNNRKIILHNDNQTQLHHDAARVIDNLVSRATMPVSHLAQHDLDFPPLHRSSAFTRHIVSGQSQNVLLTLAITDR